MSTYEKKTLLGLGLVFASMLGLAGVAEADPSNLPPPSGAILDLDGGVIPHGAPQEYTVSFTAAVANTAITFAFREDPAFIFASDFSVVDTTTSSGNLLSNGDFSTGDLTDWTYANIYGASYGGVVTSSCEGYFSSCWYDGAVQAYDAISQSIVTNVGDVYEISFYATDNSDLSNWSRLSTNGDVTDVGGNGVDITAYAQAGLPPPGTPEPSTWAMMILGFLGLGYAGYRRAKASVALS